MHYIEYINQEKMSVSQFGLVIYIKDEVPNGHKLYSYTLLVVGFVKLDIN